MARLISKDEVIEIPDGADIQPAADKLGVPFSCTNGYCATCQIEVVEGEENLTPKTRNEIEMELEPKIRLACQCRIKKGSVKIRF
jgi:ferredoxin